MLRPVIAIVGRPNVGKSTLFNRLVGRRQALVRDTPGVTRDRLYGQIHFERWQATVIDTGGFDPGSTEPLVEGVRRQVLAAVDDADLIAFVVDARAGATALDEEIARLLRKANKPVVLVANKVDDLGQEPAVADLYRLGFGDPLGVSSEHGRGVAEDTPFVYEGRSYVLVDTAGIRRKGKVTEALEKLSVVMALKSLERAQVALLVMDATEGLTAQDAHIAGYAHEAGRASVVVVNKWDLVPRGMVRKAEVVEQVRDRLPFLDYAPLCFTSATEGQGLRELFETIDRIAAEAQKRVPADEVTAVLRQALDRRPVSVAGEPLAIQSANQVSVGPPTFAVRVNRPDGVHFSYERYLAKSVRHAFGFEGSPLRLSFRRAGRARPSAPKARR